MSAHLRLIGVAIAALLIGSMIGWGTLFASDDPDSRGDDLSLLNSERGPDDVLPSHTRDTDVPQLLSDPDAARLAQRVDGRAYYLAPGKGDDVCIIEAFEDPNEGPITAYTCASRQLLERQAIYLSEPLGDQINVAVIMPDDLQEASVGSATVSAKNNFAVVRGPLPAEGTPSLVLQRGDGSERRVDLHLQAPDKLEVSEAP